MAGRADFRRRTATLCGVQFVDVLGVTSAITAIPATLEGVSAPATAAPILATVYAMFFGGLLVLGARLGDRYGHRRMLIGGTLAFTAAGLLGAVAQNIAQVVAARGLQGAAAAMSVPPALRLLLDAAPGPAVRRDALAAWSASGAAAGALGLLIGGVLTDVFGWRAVFWVNLPVGVVLGIAIRLTVPRSPPDDARMRIDLVGAALLTAAVMAVIVGASLCEDPDRRTTGGLLVAAGLALGAAFAVQQRVAAAPLVPRAAFASANLRTGASASFVNTATTSSTGVLATLLMQEQLGVSAVGAGLALLPFSLGVIGGSALSRPLGRRLATRPLAATGLAGIAMGNVLLALTHGSVTGIVCGVLIAGVGLGMASVAATTIGTDVADDLSGTASGVLNTGAQLGTAIGVAALLVLAQSIDAPWPGTAMAWALAGAIASLSALALVRPGPRRSRSRSRVLSVHRCARPASGPDGHVTLPPARPTSRTRSTSPPRQGGTRERKR